MRAPLVAHPDVLGDSSAMYFVASEFDHRESEYEFDYEEWN
ncbi:hypothetical protein N9D23_00440 [Rubripirellula sp.]|nr:hypothetical protein [Rubripirellula sp.]